MIFLYSVTKRCNVFDEIKCSDFGFENFTEQEFWKFFMLKLRKVNPLDSQNKLKKITSGNMSIFSLEISKNMKLTYAEFNRFRVSKSDGKNELSVATAVLR